jgi:predicted phosphodiesterase
MKIQFMSDLHLEFMENLAYFMSNPIKKVGEVLILCGDIVPFYYLKNSLRIFCDQLRGYELVLWIPGNHEYYHSDMKDKIGSFDEIIDGNIHLVNNITYKYKDVNIICSTMWTHISESSRLYVERGMSDYSVIKYGDYWFSSNVCNDIHDESVQFITAELEKHQGEKCIVATHHVPTLINYPEKHRDSFINEGFAVEHSDVINRLQPMAWIYGHSHFNTPDFNIGQTKMLTNQLGYVKYGEQEGFSYDRYIDSKL